MAKHTSITFDPELREQLDDYCRRTRLGLSAAVNVLLGEALHDHHTRREHINAWEQAAKKYAPARPDVGDPTVCGTCESGYYGASCPVCNP